MCKLLVCVIILTVAAWLIIHFIMRCYMMKGGYDYTLSDVMNEKINYLFSAFCTSTLDQLINNSFLQPNAVISYPDDVEILRRVLFINSKILSAEHSVCDNYSFYVPFVECSSILWNKYESYMIICGHQVEYHDCFGAEGWTEDARHTNIFVSIHKPSSIKEAKILQLNENEFFRLTTENEYMSNENDTVQYSVDALWQKYHGQLESEFEKYSDKMDAGTFTWEDLETILRTAFEYDMERHKRILIPHNSDTEWAVLDENFNAEGFDWRAKYEYFIHDLQDVFYAFLTRVSHDKMKEEIEKELHQPLLRDLDDVAVYDKNTDTFIQKPNSNLYNDDIKILNGRWAETVRTRVPELYSLLIKPVKLVVKKVNNDRVITGYDEKYFKTTFPITFNFDLYEDEELRTLLPEPIIYRRFKYDDSNGKVTLSTNFILYAIKKHNYDLDNTGFINKVNTILNKKHLYLNINGDQFVTSYLDDKGVYHATLDPLKTHYYTVEDEYTYAELSNDLSDFVKSRGKRANRDIDNANDVNAGLYNVYVGTNGKDESSSYPDDNCIPVVRELHELLYMFNSAGLIDGKSNSIDEALQKIKRNIDKLGNKIDVPTKKELQEKVLRLSCLMKFMYHDAKDSKNIKYSEVIFDPNAKNSTITFKNASFEGIKKDTLTVDLPSPVTRDCNVVHPFIKQ